MIGATARVCKQRIRRASSRNVDEEVGTRVAGVGRRQTERAWRRAAAGGAGGVGGVSVGGGGGLSRVRGGSGGGRRRWECRPHRELRVVSTRALAGRRRGR